MNKFEILSNLMFKDDNYSIEELENKYPLREIKGAVTRFAPSPTGFFHTGSLFTALICKKIADATDGSFILRIEDTDKKREVKGSVTELTSQMKEFKVEPCEGVISENEEVGNYGPYTQSKRGEIYRSCAKYLVSKGLAYPCFCSSETLNKIRESQEKNKQITGYYGQFTRCRNLSVDEMIEKVENNEPYVVRLKSSGNYLNKVSFIDEIKGKIEIMENYQDAVIIKSDRLPTYHFAHVVDDHFMRTTYVIRGEEWIASTPLHIELFNKMNFDLPKYAHTPSILIKDEGSKRKLSKRKDKEAAASFFLSSGYEVDSILEYMLTIINSNFEPWKRANGDKSIHDFDVTFKKINKAGALFDMDKLIDICKQNISKLSSTQLFDKVISWSKDYDNKAYELFMKNETYTKAILAIERDNVKKVRKDYYKYSDILEYNSYFFDELFEKDVLKGYNFNNEIDNKLITDVISRYIEVLDLEAPKSEWFETIKKVAEEFNFCTNMKEYKSNKEAYNGSVADVACIIRVAVTNRTNSPDIYSIMKVLKIDKVKERLNKVLLGGK